MEAADTWAVQIVHELVLQLLWMPDESYLDTAEWWFIMAMELSVARRKYNYTLSAQLALS